MLSNVCNHVVVLKMNKAEGKVVGQGESFPELPATSVEPENNQSKAGWKTAGFKLRVRAKVKAWPGQGQGLNLDQRCVPGLGWREVRPVPHVCTGP